MGMEHGNMKPGKEGEHSKNEKQDPHAIPS